MLYLSHLFNFTQKSMTKTDLLTGQKFEARRINQNFATPENRIKFYNQKANNLRHINSYVNKPLHANICILNELLAGKNEATFHKQFLSGKGFSFGVHTHYIEHNKITRIAIYQYIIIPLENDQIKILRK